MKIIYTIHDNFDRQIGTIEVNSSVYTIKVKSHTRLWVYMNMDNEVSSEVVTFTYSTLHDALEALDCEFCTVRKIA